MTATHTAPTASSSPAAADAYVLENRDLQEDVLLAATSRFGDDVWDLTPLNHQAHHRMMSLHFPSLPPQFQAVAKELFYALLTCEPPEGEGRLRPTSVRAAFTKLKQFMEWADRNDVPSFAAMTPADLTSYQAWLLTQSGVSPSTRGTRRRAIRLMWLYRDYLHSDRLTFDPQVLTSWEADNCQPPGRLENSTERIPEEVMGPLLVWSLRWVNDFSADIIAAHQDWTALTGSANPRTFTGRNLDVRLAAFEELLERYRQTGRPLPASAPGRVNLRFLERQLQLEATFLSKSKKGRALLEAAVAELGIADATYLFTPALSVLDGKPWIEGFEFPKFDDTVRLLQAACYIVIAYQSGMRDSEIKHLRAGSVSHRTDSAGIVYRRLINSLAFKGENNPRGTPATWVISEAVEKAITVLEQIQDGNTYLFGTLRGTRSRDTERALVTSITNLNLNRFADWINHYCELHGRPDSIPLVRQQRWNITTSQFRRTLAWFIARRAGGTIAGTIQYRHHSIQMFEGYAGTSSSGFRAEVEAEQALQRGEALLAMTEGHQHQQLQGPAADEAHTRLTNFQRSVAYAGSVVTDPKRLTKIMARHDPNIHLGTFVTCVYNPDKALCRRRLTDERATPSPDLATCEPFRCRNVALTPQNVNALTTHQTNLRKHLQNAELLAPYVLHRLEAQHRELVDFLASIDTPTGTP